MWMEFVEARFNYWIYVVLMMIGLYAMIAKKNLVKKLIGMTIFQTAIILFYVSIGAKEGATIPILEHGAEAHGETAAQAIEVAHYINPLPHVLMLTAIVVGVATLGVGLAVLQKIHSQYDTLEEDKILKKFRL